MPTTDINDIFNNIRAKRGDFIAQDSLDSDRMQDFDLQLESLSMSLQMQFSRIQSTSLHKIKTHEIGREIKKIVHNGMDELITLYLKNEEFYDSQLTKLMEKIKNEMRYEVRIQAQKIQELNLIHDFEKIAYELNSLEYSDIIRVLKGMLIITIHRRAERRHFLSA